MLRCKICINTENALQRYTHYDGAIENCRGGWSGADAAAAPMMLRRRPGLQYAAL
jgi:hypothetical protein